MNDENIHIMNRVPLFAYLTNTVDLRFYQGRYKNGELFSRSLQTSLE